MNHHNVAKGRPVAILGGGPSLPAHMETLARDWPEAVLLGINFHAPKLVDCDYIFFNDEWTGPQVAEYPGTKVGRFPAWCDILRPCAPGNLSSCLAVEVAREMGGRPILLAGMDCGEDHFDGSVNDRKPDLQKHLRYWSAIDRRDVIPIGGPLVSFFARLEYPKAEPTTDVMITEARNVPVSRDRAIDFKPGRQALTPEKLQAAREAGIVKEN